MISGVTSFQRTTIVGSLGVFLLSLWIALGNSASAQSTFLCFGEPATIVGSGGADTLNGTSGNDVIVGLAGRDTIDGRGGNDLICGGDWSDSIQGGPGDDKIEGGLAWDTISGGDGDDRIFGGTGGDLLSGNAGNDKLFGEEGSDSMNGGVGTDNCFVESNGDEVISCETNLPPNEAPVANPDGPTSVNEDGGPAEVPGPGVLTNDTDADGPLPITAVLSTAPSHAASFTLNADGSFSYTPSGNYCGADSFAYVARDGDNAESAPATATIEVACINDAPSFTKGPNQTVAEDSGAQTVNPWAASISAGPGSESGQTATFSVTGNTNPSLFSDGPAVSPTGALSYTPAPNEFGSATITIRLQDSGGTAGGGVDTSESQSFDITVDPVNDAPSFTKGPDQTVDESSGAHTVNPWATALSTGPANESGQTLSFTVSNNNSSLFSVQPAVSAAGVLTYTLEVGKFGSATITVRLSDNGGVAGGGIDTSAPQNFTISVNALNAAPVNNLSPATSVNEDAVSTLSGSAAISVSDSDAGGDPVQVTLAAANGLMTLDGTSGLTFTVGTGSADANLKFTGTISAINDALDGMTFTPSADYFGAASIQVTTDDLGNNGAGGAQSDTDTLNITVNPVNDAPSFTKGPDQSVGENTGAHTVDPWASGLSTGPANESGQTLNFTVTNNNSSLFSVQPAVSPTGVLTYTVAPNAGGSATITITLSDNGGIANGGADTSAAQSFTITVNPVNDAPVNNMPAAPSVLEDAVLTLSGAGAISVSDTDAGTNQVKVTLTSVNGTMTLDGTAGLSITSGADGTATMAFTGTVASINAALDGMVFTPTPNLFGAATIAITTDDQGFTGAGGAKTDSDTLDVTVTPVNDAPSFTKGADQTFDEDSGAHTADPWAGAVSAGPGEAGQALTFNVTNNTNPTLFSSAPAVSPAGVLTFTSAPNAFGTATITLTLSDNGGTTNGGADTSAPQTFVITINPVNDPPTSVADSFDAVGNTGLFVGTTKPLGDAGKQITGSVLTNDTDLETPGSLVVETVTNSPTTLGGTVTIEADGNFTYHPDDNDTTSIDSFTYRACDSAPSPCTSTTDANATGTINLVLNGQVWYVRNNHAAGGDGTSDAPFDTLAEAEAAAGAADTVYVFDGDDTQTNLDTGYVMETDARLLGEVNPLDIDPDGSGALPTVGLFPGTPAALPTLAATNEDVVVMAPSSEVNGFNINPGGTGGGIAGGPGAGGGAAGDVTVARVNINDTGTAGTQPGIDLDSTTGVNRFSEVTVTNGGSAAAIGVRINNAGTVSFAATGTISISTTGAKALDAAGTNMSTSTFDDVSVTGSGTGAIRLNNNTGQTVLGDGAGTDLSLQTTSGATAALDVSSGGTVQVGGAGDDTISATGGPAVDIRNTNGSIFDFDSVSSANSAGDGINLDTNLGTPFATAAGSISGAAGIAVDVNGGGSGGDVGYAGAINDGAGQTAEVTARNGGSVTLSGNIGDSSDAGGGIVVSGNTGGSTTFSGNSKVLNTGAGDAVLFTNSDGHALRFQNGNLDVDTTTGRGLEASTSGSIEVLGTANTITTGTGRALNITTTDITANDVTFEKISSNGAPNGILLNTTGNANGRLFVTGLDGTCSTAANCTGAAIQNSTGAGIDLTNVPGGVTLTRVAVTAGGDDGIRATTVNDVDLTDSVVLNNGNFHGGGLEERGLDYMNVTGSPEIVRTTVSGSEDSNAHIQNNAAGETTLTVTQSTFSGSKFNAGLRLRGEGPSSMDATVTGSVFSLNADPGFSMQTDSANTAQQTLLFNNNDVSGGSSNAVSGRPQISINAGGASIIKATVSNNDIKSAAGHEVILNTLASHTGTFDAKVTGNDIGDGQPGVLDALADGGTAINGWAHGDGINRMEISNNTIQNWGGRAMELSLNDGNGDADYTVTGNVMSNPDASSNTFEGIYIFSGGALNDAADVCVDMENNDMDGIGRNGVSDIGLDRYNGNILRFADFNDTSVPNLQNNLRAKNPLSPALTVETFSNGPTATADTACDPPTGTP